MHYYFAFGDEPKLVKNSALAVILLSGLFGAVLSASSSLAREIHRGTALAVLAKPVGRARFVLAKFAGVAVALVLLVYVDVLAALLGSRMAFDAYGSRDWFAMGLFVLGMVLAYLLGGFSNFFLRRPFVSDASVSLVFMLSLMFVIISFFDQHGKPQAFAKGVDWNLIPAGVLLLFAVWVIAGLALACSTRLEMIPTLAVCSGFFLVGIMSDYLFGRPAGDGSWWAVVLYTVSPNWQLFWLADAVASGKSAFHWGYVAKSFAYAALYLGAVLSVAVMLFEDRELS
jgi:ABC-type transport system involved in multi-copper enzyme maturation permease subunit